jgi:hypothetical protein
VLTRKPDRVAPWAADIVVRAPLSTHPFASSALRADNAWLGMYADAVATARKAGATADVAAFLSEALGADEDDYLAGVGLRRLRELLA